MLDASPRAAALAPSTRLRHYLMCRPEHFAVTYRINPWMDPAGGVDRDLARAQWETLHRAYAAAGHQVQLIDPAPGLPDMVFAANSAVVVDGIAWTARFRHEERQGEERLYEDWFRAHGYDVHRAEHVHEGEGDFAVVGDVILAATGFRTDVAAHREAQGLFDREVVTLELVDPRFYHLDTALFALDGEQVAYFPAAFSDATREELARRYPDAIHATEADAVVFGCNAAADGTHVFLPAGADHLAREVEARGFTVVLLDLSELRKAGGSVKCCTLELRSPKEA